MISINNKLVIKTCILTLFLSMAGLAFAKEYTVGDVPNIRLQDKTRYVTDPESILSGYARSTIDSILYALEQTTGIETVVAVLPSIGNEDCFDFAYHLFNQWGVGKKGKDNGLVMLLVTDQRCIRFEVGYGLEGDLPDAISKRIQTQYMIPYLKDNDWDRGMVAGARAVYNRLNGVMENDTVEEEEIPWELIYIFGGIILLFFLSAYFAIRKSKQCPYCKKYTLQRTNSRVISRSMGRKKEEITYTCTNCGNKVTRIVESQDDNYRGRGGMGGPIIGGGFGGGFGGGGFGGGSFGGGRSGGGGAGSRF